MFGIFLKCHVQKINYLCPNENHGIIDLYTIILGNAGKMERTSECTLWVAQREDMTVPQIHDKAHDQMANSNYQGCFSSWKICE